MALRRLSRCLFRKAQLIGAQVAVFRRKSAKLKLNKKENSKQWPKKKPN